MKEQDLKQIAIDLYENKIFCDRHVSDTGDLGMVFFPIALGGLKEFTKEELQDIGMIYEYMDQAGPRSVNFMPTFFSFKTLNKKDTEAMLAHYEEYKQLRDKFVNNP